MPQFRTLPTFEVSTEQLDPISLPAPVNSTTTEPLSTFARASSTRPTTGDIIRIPGSRSSSSLSNQRVTENLTTQGTRMNAHLRHALVLVTVLTVIVFTLLSLAPLDNGQSVIPAFRGFSNWVHAEQAYLSLEAQNSQPPVTYTNTTSTTTQVQAPPPVFLPKSAYVSIAEQDASNAGISPDYFVRQINLESGFNPDAVSPSGAEGIAQFMPATAQGLGIDPFNPYQALNAAAHYMASYNSQYGGNYAMALAAYNAGGGTVQYAVSSCGSNWISCLPAQTQNYIMVIMGI
jgi:hypothetical protein